jgi:hypothetical protein
MSQFCQMFERYSLAIRFFNSALCSTDSGGSHPIGNSLGVKLVVEFLLLLCTAVAMGSHLLHLFWLVAIRCKYCSTHRFVHSDSPSV